MKSWSSTPSSLLLNGFAKQPRVRLDGQDVPIVPPHQYDADAGRLVLQLRGTVRVEILSPALPEAPDAATPTPSG